jgi:amidohydrolase family protein
VTQLSQVKMRSANGWTAVSTLIGAGGVLLTACSQPGPPTMAIRNVTVVDVIDGVLRRDHTVLVKGNHIAAVGPTAEIALSDPSETIEGTGKFLIPGLWDMHVHSVANVASDRSVRSVSNADWHFPLFLAYGVTGLRNMNDGTADPTLQLTRSVKRRLANGDLEGPRLLASGPAVDGDPPLASNPIVVRTATEARAVVDKLADHGADFVKVYENLSREAYFAIMNRARQRGLPVDGHVPFRVQPAEAAEAGQRTFEHVLAMALGCSVEAEAERKEFARRLADSSNPAVIDRSPVALFRHERRLYDARDPAACAETIEAYRRNGVAEAPSLVGYHHVVNAKAILADRGTLRLVPPAIRRNWEEWLTSATGQTVRSILAPLVPLQAENVRLLHEAKVMLLSATDVGIPMLVPGASLHEELMLLAQAGLTPLEALRTSTIDPARVLGLAGSLGSIETGKLADLVLLDANPLADVANTQRIRAVVANGRLYRREDLDRLLARVEAFSESRSPVGGAPATGGNTRE